MVSSSVFPVAALSLLMAGLVLHVTALAIPEWSTATSTSEFIRQGLFQICLNDKCARIRKPSSHIRASGAFGTLGALAMLAAFSTSFLSLVQEVSGRAASRIVRVVCLLTNVAAAILLVICIVTYGVYIRKVNGLTLHFGHSLEMSIAAACCLVLALVAQVMDFLWTPQ